jgi:hypothetical protein
MMIDYEATRARRDGVRANWNRATGEPVESARLRFGICLHHQRVGLRAIACTILF